MFKDIPDGFVKDVLAFAFAASVIIGFFMHLITVELFGSFATLVIGHYYNENDKKHLREQLEGKDNELRALNVEKARIIELDGIKKDV